jgi:SOS response regulatory protein OraA/RecX
MISKLICWLYGHDWVDEADYGRRWVCRRCKKLGGFTDVRYDMADLLERQAKVSLP